MTKVFVEQPLASPGSAKNDPWDVTPHMWHVTHGGGLTFSKNVSSPPLTFWDRQCLEDSEKKDDWINKLMNHNGVYRTAPATTGLLNTLYVAWLLTIYLFIHYCTAQHCISRPSSEPIARIFINFFFLPDYLICRSRIDQAGRLAWFAWAGLIRLEWFAWFAWAGLIRLERVPDLLEQDWWSCLGKFGNQANIQLKYVRCIDEDDALIYLL